MIFKNVILNSALKIFEWLTVINNKIMNAFNYNMHYVNSSLVQFVKFIRIIKKIIFRIKKIEKNQKTTISFYRSSGKKKSFKEILYYFNLEVIIVNIIYYFVLIYKYIYLLQYIEYFTIMKKRISQIKTIEKLKKKNESFSW